MPGSMVANGAFVTLSTNVHAFFFFLLCLSMTISGRGSCIGTLLCCKNHLFSRENHSVPAIVAPPVRCSRLCVALLTSE